jgi:Domain of unknown function (DUF6398)
VEPNSCPTHPASPYLTADELSEGFGIAKATMGTKAKLVRDLLKIDQFSPEFQRADVIAANRAVWFIEVDGLIMDARQLSLEIQEEAFRLGLIPYVPTEAAGRIARDVGAARPA